MEHVRESGRLRDSDLQLPILAAPPTSTQFVKGYEGDSLDPLKLGVACVVVPPTEGRGPNSTGDYNLNPEGGSANKQATSVDGLFAVRMSVRPHKGKRKPDVRGRFYKFMLAELEKPPVNFLVPDSAPAGRRNNREPYIVMHMRKWQKCPCSFCGDVQGDPKEERRFCAKFKDLKMRASVESYLETSLRTCDARGFAAAGVLLFRRTAASVEVSYVAVVGETCPCNVHASEWLRAIALT